MIIAKADATIPSAALFRVRKTSFTIGNLS